MNTIQAALKNQLQKEVEAHGGPQGQRAHVLQHLQLKTVIRENHNTQVIQLAVHMLDGSSNEQCMQQGPEKQQVQAPACRTGLHNLVATVGADQASVYDDQHFVDHVGLVAQFTNRSTPHHKGGALRAVSWVSCKSFSQQPSADAWLAVAGVDHVIQILSITECRVILQLHGHTHEVVDLCAAEHAPGLLLSLAQGGCVRLWHVPTAQCLACLETQAHTAALHPCGISVLTGHRAGQVCLWDVRQYTASCSTAPMHKMKQSSCAVGGTCHQEPQHVVVGAQQPERVQLQLCPALPATHPVDCIRFLPGGLVMLKTSGGHMSMWLSTQHDVTASASTQATQPQQQPHSAAGTPTVQPQWQQPQQLLSVQHAKMWQCSATPQLLWAVQVPDARTTGSYPSRCLASHCHDGSYICCGDTKGNVHVYHVATGTHVCRVGTDRVEAPVRACGLSHDCRHLWAVLGDGFVFRYAYVQSYNPTSDKLLRHEPDVSADDPRPQLEQLEQVEQVQSKPDAGAVHKRARRD